MKDTHYALTSGKDNYVKFWDLDSFEMVMRFECEMGKQIRALAFSSIGDFFVCAGVNKTIRLFQQTKDQVFPVELQNKIKEERLLEEFQNPNMNNEAMKKKHENMNQAEYLMDLIEGIEKEAK